MVLVASGQTKDDINFVAIDDLVVDFQACAEGTTTAPAGPDVPEPCPACEADKKNCATLPCNFDAESGSVARCRSRLPSSS